MYVVYQYTLHPMSRSIRLAALGFRVHLVIPGNFVATLSVVLHVERCQPQAKLIFHIALLLERDKSQNWALCSVLHLFDH